jgi:hypothetical protein
MPTVNISVANPRFVEQREIALARVDDPQCSVAEDHTGEQFADDGRQRAARRQRQRRAEQRGGEDQCDQAEIHLRYTIYPTPRTARIGLGVTPSRSVSAVP